MARSYGAQMEATRCSVSLAEERCHTTDRRSSVNGSTTILFLGTTWWQFFEVIGLLNRFGRIAINPTDHRDDLISISPRYPA